VTAQQIIVLVLLVAAFAVGWLAGRNRSKKTALRDLLVEAESALAPAVPARGRALEDALTPLADIERRLGQALPDGHPIAEDFSQTLAALQLLGRLRGRDADVAAEVERALRLAHARFRREVATVVLIDERPDGS
jgi:hypothetical protein